MFIFDFSAIKSGGGAQLAINFLINIAPEVTCKVIISEEFPQENLIPAQLSVIKFRSRGIARLFDEYITLRAHVTPGDVIYTFFGPGLPRIRGVRQVTGVAYPIVCNYDSPFWRRHSLRVLLPKRLLNKLREARLKNADHLIFETDIMRSRFCSRHDFPVAKTSVLPPTPTSFLTKSPARAADSELRILFLTGLDPHKNIDLIVRFIESNYEQLEQLPKNVRFVISCSKQNFIRRFRLRECGLWSKYFEFVGAVPSNEIQELYDNCDFVANVSDLESFSNNYMEAWLSGTPLILHRTDFSEYICRESGVYIDIYDETTILSALRSITSGLDFNKYIIAGDELLRRLPSYEERKVNLLRILDLK